jgi:hypothetical protein
MRVYFRLLCIGAPPPPPPLQNTLVRPSIRPLPKKWKLVTMQEDGTTNPTLTNPGSADSNSRNLKNSSKYSRQFTIARGTNEVALWAPQPYIVPFAKLTCSITGAQSLCFFIRLQPRDQGPTTYTVMFPGAPSALGLGGAFFSHHAQVRMLMFKIIK